MRTVQYALSTDNPVAAAKFYNRLIDNVIEILFGFDRKKQRSKRNGGIFGHVKAFAGSTETQGTGNLHFHCLLWIHGVRPTVAEIDRILSDEEHGPKFTGQLIGFTTVVMEHSLPISPDIVCVQCGAPSSDSYRPLPLPESAKMPHPRFGPKAAPVIGS